MEMLETMEGSGQVIRTGAWLYLDEITHRVLNDYTVMLSIIRRASMAVSDQRAGQALEEVAIRLGAASAAWQALRPPSGMLPQNLDETLAAVCKAISDSNLAGRQIELSLISDPLTIGGRRCWQISLVVAELILNAARHAFGPFRGGSIVVDVRAHAACIQCAVIDDGGATPIISPGRGCSIMDGLASELGGTITRTHTDRGSTVMLCVPMVEAMSRTD
jgi:two-component system, sensor histidine kinase PdtaS